MNKEWFIIINGQQEGPYSLTDLKFDKRLTPDTLVWKKGFKDWTPIRYVSELKEVFEDETEEPKTIHEKLKPKPLPQDVQQETLTLHNDPFQFWLWFLIIALIVFYVFYLFYRIQ
jgi:hypothetical protein